MQLVGGGVKLLVTADNAERAREILSPTEHDG
jgi:hypothetical protein